MFVITALHLLSHCLAEVDSQLCISAVTQLHVLQCTCALIAMWSKIWLRVSASMLMCSAHSPLLCTRPNLPLQALQQPILSACCQLVSYECRYQARHAFVSCGTTVVHLRHWSHSRYKGLGLGITYAQLHYWFPYRCKCYQQA